MKSQVCEVDLYVVAKGTATLGMDVIRRLSLVTPVHRVHQSNVTTFVHKVKLKRGSIPNVSETYCSMVCT